MAFDPDQLDARAAVVHEGSFEAAAQEFLASASCSAFDAE